MSKTNVEQVMTKYTGIEFDGVIDARAEAFAVIDDLLDAVYMDSVSERQTSDQRACSHMLLARVAKHAAEYLTRYRTRHTSNAA